MAPEMTNPWRFVLVGPEMSVKYPIKISSLSRHSKDSGNESEVESVDEEFGGKCWSLLKVLLTVSWSVREEHKFTLRMKEMQKHKRMTKCPDDLLLTPHFLKLLIRVMLFRGRLRGHDVSIRCRLCLHQVSVSSFDSHEDSLHEG